MRCGALGLLCLVALIGCAPQRQPLTPTTPIPVDTIRAKVTERFATLESPGAVFGVFRGPDSTPLVVLTLGHADERKSRAITRKDHFRIASVTKLFVGTVVLQLVDEGRIRLDDPVSKYLDAVPNGNDITVAMLGYHTSGLPRVIANPAYQQAIQAEPARQWKAAEILPYAWQMKPLFPPGKGWMYSNTNTVLLGELIQSVTGRPWHEEVRARILVPLGLLDTGYPVESKVPEPTPRGYRFGKKENLIKYGDYWFDATRWSGSCWGAAGDMYSTLDDLATCTRAAARGDLVSETGRTTLFKWIRTGYEGVEYGFHIGRQSGVLGSTGDVPGFSAFAAYHPELDVTIVSLANLTATRAKATAAAELGELTVGILRQLAYRPPEAMTAVQ
jgi:D-alanyl-D-alanine carboxypeptidase